MDFALPALMVAPNGARRTKQDHPAVPVTVAETVACARDCYAAGADAIHAHVRDAQAKHVLDVGLYRELLQEMRVQVPEMRVQVTSEAAGVYSAAQQQTIMRELSPDYLSVAWREMVRVDAGADDRRRAAEFYQWAAEGRRTIQHILYERQDLREWFASVGSGMIPVGKCVQLLFVLGRYRENLQSEPADLLPFLDELANQQLVHPALNVEWAVCAFGVAETSCLQAAIVHGGNVRVGFENGLWSPDGSVAEDNVARVRCLRALLDDARG